MKKLFLLLSIIGLILGGCEKIDSLTQFEIEYEETIVIPSFIGIKLPFNIMTPNIKTSSESIFEINNTKKDLVEQIMLSQLNLTLVSPENSNFSFLDAIEIYLVAEDLPEIRIAWKDNISNDTEQFIVLNVTELNLHEYIKKDSIALKINTTTDKILTSEHQIEIYSEFFVDAKILGI